MGRCHLYLILDVYIKFMNENLTTIRVLCDVIQRQSDKIKDLETNLGIVNAASLKLHDENERLRRASTPICVGEQIITILANDGHWVSMDGNSVVAADGLYNNNPYDTIRRLESYIRDISLKYLK